MISPVFFTSDQRFARQMVGRVYRLYDGIDGDFITEFRSLSALCEYITERMRNR